ncbi:MAG: polyphosphate polymerase domain-containing protein [Anaerolineaceae bacterium]|nr:polyphosphate polymerase domain-containing protein [Anaerolineaceae bacterium]
MIDLYRQPIEQPEMADTPAYKSHTRRIERLIGQFAPISLSEMKQVALLDRTDTKYVFGISQLDTILQRIMDKYHVLCIDGSHRLHHYQTLYLDTNDFALYHQHHNGRRSRYKVRVREYTDSDLAFWEVKRKTNQNHTIKSRYQMPGLEIEMDEPVDRFVATHMPVDVDQLEPKMWNKFQRITLVSDRYPERLTLDINLTFGWGDAVVTLPGVVIAEVKQPHFSQRSDFIQEARKLGIRPYRFSKYCAGIYMLYDNVKINNFKSRIQLVDAIMQKESGHEYLR